MNLKQLEYALAVAECQSFTLAAERCHIVQSALSHQVARLEQTLGAKLFERNSRKVALTPAGQAFVASARLAVEAARRVRHDVAAACGEIRGSLAIGSISTLTSLDLIGALARFHRQFNAVDIRLKAGQSEALLDDVRQRLLDVAFVGVWPGQRLEGVQWRLLEEQALVAVFASDHPLAGRASVMLGELQALPRVDFPAGSSARRQTDEAFAAQRLQSHVQFEVDGIGLMEQVIRKGLAMGLVPASVAGQFQGLAAVPVQEAPKRRVYLVWAASPTPAAQAFIGGLVEDS